MTRMKGYGDLEELSYTQLRRGAQYYEVFHFEGSFCHESKHSSSTPKLMEVLGGSGTQTPSESWSFVDRKIQGRRLKRSSK